MKLADIKRAELNRKGGKEIKELEGEAAGDERAFIPSTAPGWQIERVRYPSPGTAGGELVTGSLSRKG